MSIFSNRVNKHEIKDGDHIYTYRAAFTYSHHGIFVGGNKVVHFTPTMTGSSNIQSSWFNFSGLPNISASCPASGMSNMSACCPASGMSNMSACCPTSGMSNISACGPASGMPNISSCSSTSGMSDISESSPTSDMSDISVSPPTSDMSDISVSSPTYTMSNISASCPTSGMSNTSASCPASYPDCGFRQPNSGVIITCLECFLQNSSPYRFEYGVGKCFFLTRVRGGTCTTAVSDPPQTVINRAMHLLQYGFGKYDLLQNNCEDFALYCKTGLLAVNKHGGGSSGQASNFLGVRMSVVLSSSVKYYFGSASPVSMAALTAGMYYINRYSSDIGVRTDVTKVAMEDVAAKRGGLNGNEGAEQGKKASD